MLRVCLVNFEGFFFFFCRVHYVPQCASGRTIHTDPSVKHSISSVTYKNRFIYYNLVKIRPRHGWFIVDSNRFWLVTINRTDDAAFWPYNILLRLDNRSYSTTMRRHDILLELDCKIINNYVFLYIGHRIITVSVTSVLVPAVNLMICIAFKWCCYGRARDI